MIINKDNVNFATQFSNNPYEAYQDFSEQLLISSIRDNEILTVLADYAKNSECLNTIKKGHHPYG